MVMNCQASDLSNGSGLRRVNASGLRAKAQVHLSESELQFAELKLRIKEPRSGIQRLKPQVSELKPGFISQS